MITYTRNLIEGNDFPYLTQYAGFDTGTYFMNLQWNLENLFVNTFERGPININVYPVEGNLVIVGDSLQPFDHFHLSNAEDYNTYVMPNGMLLIDYYQSFIVDVYEYLDTLDNSGKRGNVSRRFSSNLVDPIEVKINWNFEKMYVGVRFYDENDEPIVATAGTIELSAVAATGGIEAPIADGVMDATDAAPVVPVEVPLERLVATPSGLEGVDHWQLIIWQI